MEPPPDSRFFLLDSRPFSFRSIHLQWFAAEDEGRTEEPTERKLRRAREEEGQTVKSKELVDALVLLLPALAILFLAPGIRRTCEEMLVFFLTRATEIDPSKDSVIVPQVFRYFTRLALPIIAVSLAAALAAHIGQDMAQFGFHFTTKPLSFKWNKIVPNFGAFFQKTVFSPYGAFNFFKQIVKIAVIGVVAYLLIYSEHQKIANLQTASLILGIQTIGGLAARLLIICALFLLVLAIPDYLVQRWQHRESLKMSKEEVKWEFKETEGDPQVRARIRQRMRELLTIGRVVPKADVVITNPTHLAIALEFNNTLPGPHVLAKGEDEQALLIKRTAQANDVPVVENKPLARDLYPVVEVGSIVPEKFWIAISEILVRVRGAEYFAQKNRV